MTEAVMLQARRNLSERSNALGLKCIGRFDVEDVGTEKRPHDAATKTKSDGVDGGNRIQKAPVAVNAAPADLVYTQSCD